MSAAGVAEPLLGAPSSDEPPTPPSDKPPPTSTALVTPLMPRRALWRMRWLNMFVLWYSLLNWFEGKYGRRVLVEQLNITSYPWNGGKSVMDDAQYNAECRELVAAKGGTNKCPRIKMPGDKLRPGHPWHRHTHQ